MPDRAFPLTADRVLSGRYRLVAPLARGGMAEVWEAHDDVLTRAVAVKILHRHLADDAGFVERFRREAVAAARLTHPGIVATFDTGADDGVAFIVMELVRGRTLRQAMEEGPLSTATAVHVAAQVADALEHAHRAGLVHRDVKPANILLCEDPEGATRVKVADFGIVKLQAGGSDLTQTGAVVGTAKYLSPEQVEGRSPDARSDVYSLGVVLYEMLCGRPPFVADTELATALQHVRDEAPAPRRLRAGIPRPLEQVVLKALAKDPDARFQSAADLRGVLLAVDLGPDDADPLVVRDPTPPGGIVPLARPRRRNWVPALVVVALVAATVGVALSVLPSGDDEGGPATTPGEIPRTVALTTAHSFDPQGDGSENEDEAALAVDGRADTAWVSSRYTTRQFGNLKEGVGLWVEFPSTALKEVVVRSPGRDWSVAVYVDERPGRELADWGAPVDRRTAVDGDARIGLDGRRGGALLVWITDPGVGNRAEITEVSVRV